MENSTKNDFQLLNIVKNIIILMYFTHINIHNTIMYYIIHDFMQKYKCSRAFWTRDYRITIIILEQLNVKLDRNTLIKDTLILTIILRKIIRPIVILCLIFYFLR